MRLFDDFDFDCCSDYAPDPDDQPQHTSRQCGTGAHHECVDRRCTCCHNDEER